MIIMARNKATIRKHLMADFEKAIEQMDALFSIPICPYYSSLMASSSLKFLLMVALFVDMMIMMAYRDSNAKCCPKDP